jgi:hypothetical protein
MVDINLSGIKDGGGTTMNPPSLASDALKHPTPDTVR